MVGGFEVAGAGVYLPAPASGVLRSNAWLERRRAFMPFLVHSRWCSVLRSGVRSWRCRPSGLVIGQVRWSVAGSWIPVQTFAFG